MGRTGMFLMLALCVLAVLGLFYYAVAGGSGSERMPLALLLAVPVVLLARAVWRRLG